MAEDFPLYKPTPTQEENDLAAVGMNVIDKDHDGSPSPEEVAPGVLKAPSASDEPRAQARGKAPSPPPPKPAAAPAAPAPAPKTGDQTS